MSDDEQREWLKQSEARRKAAEDERLEAEDLKMSDDKDPYCLARKKFNDGRVVRLYQMFDGVSIKEARTDTDLGFSCSWDYFGKDMINGITQYINYDGTEDPTKWTRESK